MHARVNVWSKYLSRSWENAFVWLNKESAVEVNIVFTQREASMPSSCTVVVVGRLPKSSYARRRFLHLVTYRSCHGARNRCRVGCWKGKKRLMHQKRNRQTDSMCVSLLWCIAPSLIRQGSSVAESIAALCSVHRHHYGFCCCCCYVCKSGLSGCSLHPMPLLLVLLVGVMAG